MRKMTLLFLSLLLTVTAFAQTPGSAEKNAGNAAWKAKNYAEAFKNFEAYLKAIDYKDKSYLYNTAVAANRAKQYEAAEKYFGMAIKERYKEASAYLGKAKVQEAQNKDAEMLATLQEGLLVAKGNAKLENMYGSCCMREGQACQKSGDLDNAVENYIKVTTLVNTTLVNKNLKVSSFLSLGALYFNKGANILKVASPFANSDKDKFAAEKAKAVADFKKAKSYVVQAQALDAANATAKTLIGQINTAMK